MIERKSPEASCRVFTFKEGLLSAVAHDLELEVGVFRVAWSEDERRVEATFEAGSLRVLGAVRGGRPDPAALSASDRAKIEAAIREDVLHAGRYPTVRFTSTEVSADRRVQGELELHGQRRPLTAQVRLEGNQFTCEVELHQPNFGITPYRAALGTLKVKPGVRVRLAIPR